MTKMIETFDGSLIPFGSIGRIGQLDEDRGGLREIFDHDGNSIGDATDEDIERSRMTIIPAKSGWRRVIYGWSNIGGLIAEDSEIIAWAVSENLPPVPITINGLQDGDRYLIVAPNGRTVTSDRSRGWVSLEDAVKALFPATAPASA